MPDYQNGRIYTIRCRTDNTLIYVGSTTMPLSRRFSLHKTNKGCSLYKLIQNNFNGDWCDWYIELYEEYPCNNKEILNKREGEIQREIATINKNKAGRTQKEYFIDNRDEKLEKIKQYYLNNRDKILEQMKEYYQENQNNIKEYFIDNRDKRLEQMKQNYLNNRDERLEQMKQYYILKKSIVPEKK